MDINKLLDGIKRIKIGLITANIDGERIFPYMEEAQKIIARQQWIPVEKRLPDSLNGLGSDKVLIARGVKDKEINFGWLRDGVWVDYESDQLVNQELITHWMPLPDKPVT